LILFGAWKLPDLARRLGRDFKGFGGAVLEALDVLNRTREFLLSGLDIAEEPRRTARQNLLLWIAQGFGAGRSVLAPGTMGSLAGVVWFVCSIWPGQFWLYLGLTSAAVLFAVPCCGFA